MIKIRNDVFIVVGAVLISIEVIDRIVGDLSPGFLGIGAALIIYALFNTKKRKKNK